MKKSRIKDAFLEQLRKVPIIQVAAEKTDLSRNSVYRWRNTDEKFRKEMDEAMTEGEALINDMTESQLLTLIKEKNWPAMSFWLKTRNPKFRDKVEITARVTNEPETLTLKQKEIIREALKIVKPKKMT